MELQILNLSKTYSNGVEALKDVTLTIPQGMYGLLVYGSDPGGTYSDMRGLEPFIGPWLLFKLYCASTSGPSG